MSNILYALHCNCFYIICTHICHLYILLFARHLLAIVLQDKTSVLHVRPPSNGKWNLVVGVEMHVCHVGILLHIVVWHTDSKHGLQTEGVAGHFGVGGHVVTRGVLVVRRVHLWRWMVGWLWRMVGRLWWVVGRLWWVVGRLW